MRITNRKLLVGGGSMIALTAFAVFCGFMPAAIPVYGPYATAVTSLSGLYFAGNVGSAFVASKLGKAAGGSE